MGASFRPALLWRPAWAEDCCPLRWRGLPLADGLRWSVFLLSLPFFADSEPDSMAVGALDGVRLLLPLDDGLGAFGFPPLLEAVLDIPLLGCLPPCVRRTEFQVNENS